ncbi:MAG: thioredoxin domain-containing protein, partial [Nanoarchaeota archaeon]|nr:thioredoxin domain-containing protein [Nanoarchaeota archaeon]
MANINKWIWVFLIIVLCISYFSVVYAVRVTPVIKTSGYQKLIDFKPEIDDSPYLGNITAPITIIVYNELGCDGCNAFYIQTYPYLYDNYIKTGKARLYYRPLLLGRDISEKSLNYNLTKSLLCTSDAGDKYWEAFRKINVGEYYGPVECDIDMKLSDLAQENQFFGIIAGPTIYIGINNHDNTIITGIPAQDRLRRIL